MARAPDRDAPRERGRRGDTAWHLPPSPPTLRQTERKLGVGGLVH